MVAGSASNWSNPKKNDFSIGNRNFLETAATCATGYPFGTDDEPSGFDNGSLNLDTYLARVQHCAESGDPVRMEAAIDAMKRTLGKDQE